MNRTLLLALAVLLGVAAIALSVRDILVQPPPPPPRTIAVARTDIPTYTRIEPDMLEEREVPADQARFAYSMEDAIGTMSTEPIKAGQIIGRGEAKPVEEVRFVEDLGFEITSFSGRYDEMVGGQLKPGARVNIYGYHESQGRENPGDVTLVARNVWVVDVRASSGEAAGQPPPTPSQSGGGGLLGGPGLSDQGEVPASILTVAAEPEVVWHIIEALGAGGYQAWVTLAGSQTFLPTPTPEPTVVVQATYTPLPTYTPFPSPTPAEQANMQATPTPEIVGTPTPGELPTTGGERPGN
jgi:hypothetical protein